MEPNLKTFPKSEPIHDLNQARNKLADMYDWKRHFEAVLREYLNELDEPNARFVVKEILGEI